MLTAHIGATGKFLHARAHGVVIQNDPTDPRGVEFDPFLDQLLAREAVGIAGRPEQRQHARPLLDFVPGDRLIVHKDHRLKKVLRCGRDRV